MDQLGWLAGAAAAIVEPVDVVALGPTLYLSQQTSEQLGHGDGRFSSLYVYAGDGLGAPDIAVLRCRNTVHLALLVLAASIVLRVILKISVRKAKFARRYGAWEHRLSLAQDYAYVAIGGAAVSVAAEAGLQALLVWLTEQPASDALPLNAYAPEAVMLAYSLSLLRLGEFALVQFDAAVDLHPRSWWSHAQTTLSMLIPLAVYYGWVRCAWGYVTIPVALEASRLALRCVYNAYFKWLRADGWVKRWAVHALMGYNMLAVTGVLAWIGNHQQQKYLGDWTLAEHVVYPLTVVYGLVTVFWWVYKASGERSGLEFVQRLVAWQSLCDVASAVGTLFFQPVRRGPAAYAGSPRPRSAKTYVPSKSMSTPSMGSPRAAPAPIPVSPVRAAEPETNPFSLETPQPPITATPVRDRTEQMPVKALPQTNSTTSATPTPAWPPRKGRGAFPVGTMRQRQYTYASPTPHHDLNADGSDASEAAPLRQRPKSTGFSLFGISTRSPEKPVAQTRIGAIAEMTLETALSVADSPMAAGGRLARLVRSRAVQRAKEFAVRKVDDATWFSVQTVAQTVDALRKPDEGHEPIYDQLVAARRELERQRVQSEVERWSPEPPLNKDGLLDQSRGSRAAPAA